MHDTTNETWTRQKQEQDVDDKKRKALSKSVTRERTAAVPINPSIVVVVKIRPPVISWRDLSVLKMVLVMLLINYS